MEPVPASGGTGGRAREWCVVLSACRHFHVLHLVLSGDVHLKAAGPSAWSGALPRCVCCWSALTAGVVLAWRGLPPPPSPLALHYLLLRLVEHEKLEIS